MKITESSKSNSTLWDPIRSQWVAATPEEEVRQRLIQKMITELGFPKGLIAVEKGFHSSRRFDLVCYTRDLVPLLLIECKATELSEAAMHQALGYNSRIKAPFICLAGASEIKTLWEEQGRIASVPFLPTYDQLLSKLPCPTE